MLIVSVPIAGGFTLGSTTTDVDAIVAGAAATLVAYGYYVVSETLRVAHSARTQWVSKF